MGNRAVITTRAGMVVTEKNLGVYLHWNGGVNYVTGFLTYCRLKEYPSPELDNYGWARLCQVIGNFFGGGLSVGIDTVARLDTDNFDNGMYIIQNWRIIGRKFQQRKDNLNFDLYSILKEINDKQPKSEQLLDKELQIGVDEYLKERQEM